MMEPVPVSYYQLSFINFRYQLCSCVAIFTYPQVLHYSNGGMSFSPHNPICNSKLFTVLVQGIFFFFLIYVKHCIRSVSSVSYCSYLLKNLFPHFFNLLYFWVCFVSYGKVMNLPIYLNQTVSRWFLYSPFLHYLSHAFDIIPLVRPGINVRKQHIVATMFWL
ncbi:hypothetical protein MANES_08G037599v8 [Manihot esculenta]|uniref:Uncharacterized protein n=1 Tax=Manihot esculenta TaxID=3983 RepID=A0ACB7HD18_MANES|nr:hypothetical protein MANES_08G037599v8 [Manihot esculenta]